MRHGGHRTADRESMDLVLGARYGFHRQAYRRLSAERRLSRWLRTQPDRLDYARAVSRFVYEAGVDDAGRGLPTELSALPGEQCLQAGPSDSRRYLVVELPAFRCEPEQRWHTRRTRAD